jgi:DNA-binding Lrp family transcriptional regulator
MPIAFVLINTELGSEEEIVSGLNKIEGVKEVYQVYGVYDIVVKIEAETMEKLKDMVTWKIRHLDRVRSTLTLVVM